MFKSLKCQSGTEKKKKGTGDDEEVVTVAPTSSKSSKPTLARRISRWKMDRSQEDVFDSDGTHYNGEIFSSMRTKTMTVNIERMDGTLGITLRGGILNKNEQSSPILITQIKPGGPAAREGAIKAGDRLLAVNGVSLQNSTLSEAQALLKEPTPITVLTIEYDVKVQKDIERTAGPFLVEIERPDEHLLGITLFQWEDGVVIEHIAAGSIADRCGALAEGDEILAVNNQRVDLSQLHVKDVVRLLEQGSPTLCLEILPVRSFFARSKSWQSQGNMYMQQQVATNSLRPLASRYQSDSSPYDGGNLSASGWYGSSAALTHSEVHQVSILRENGTFGVEFADAPDGSIAVVAVHADGPAERSGCIYPGDRVLSIGNRNVAAEKITANDAAHLLNAIPTSQISLQIEFDVLQTVVPASGVFTVRLFKRGSAGLGLTITASIDSGYLVCELKRGSMVHRAGSVQPGDRLLEINHVPLEQCTAELISTILHQSDGLITLKLERTDQVPDYRFHRKVTCTVELQRYGGPLGITISGSEEPLQPIVVSGLTPGGLAEQTGVLQVGDEILAINEHSLSGEPLSMAHALLHNSPDLVTLKISRNISSSGGCTLENTSPAIVSSIDSAVESWGSSPSPEHSRNDHCTTKNQPPCPSNDNIHKDLLDEITNENMKIQKQLNLLAQEALTSRGDQNPPEEIAPSSTDVSNCNTIKCSPNDYVHMQPISVEPQQAVSQNTRPTNVSHARESSCVPFDFESFEMAGPRQWQTFLNASQTSIRSEFHSDQLLTVTLAKDPVYEDFGFSVSDGLYERGVFINRIRKGGPADLCRVIQPFDRILRVNETCTQDFDCCLTVPLIATAGDTLTLLVARPPLLYHNERFQGRVQSERFQSQLVSQQQFLLYPTTNKETRRIIV